jgi:hypothetical protein
MAYVERNVAGQVTGRYACPQPGYAEEWLDEDAPDLLPTLTEVRSAKLTAINAECDRRINAAVLSYPDTEVLTFAKQETEARAFLADALAATPMIDALATNRGIDKAELAGRIIAKADYFAAYTGAVIGHRQKLEDQVNAENADLNAIDPLTGWPA